MNRSAGKTQDARFLLAGVEEAQLTPILPHLTGLRDLIEEALKKENSYSK